MILTVTGHRPPKLGGYNIPNRIYNSVMEGLDKIFLQLNPSYVMVGMALGVDQWAAELCIYNQIPFIAAVPFTGYELGWPAHSQLKYRELLRKASSVTIVSTGGYAAWKLQARNEWMIDRGDQLAAVWDGTASGTGNAVGYAQLRGKQVHRVEFIRPNQNEGVLNETPRTVGRPRQPVVIRSNERQEPTEGQRRAAEQARRSAEIEARRETERERQRELIRERRRIERERREEEERAEAAVVEMQRQLRQQEEEAEAAREAEKPKRDVIQVDFGRLLDLGD